MPDQADAAALKKRLPSGVTKAGHRGGKRPMLNVVLDEDVMAWVNALAAELGVTPGEVVRRAVGLAKSQWT